MRPLKVALIVKNKPGPRERERRNMGYWSYDVPEFTWEHFSPGKDFVIERFDKFRDFDVIFHEDGGNYGVWGGCNPPVVYLSIDSTLSDNHYHIRFEQAKQADLILLDHDATARFYHAGPPVRRLGYCVNDHVFKPLEKHLDVVYHCSSSSGTGAPGAQERIKLRQDLNAWGTIGGWSYRSGVAGLDEYAANMGSARIVVNLPRTVTNRPHRILDAMAAGACVLTGPIPTVDGDGLQDRVHYRTFAETAEVPAMIGELLTDHAWTQYAINGHELVMARHTWAIRAQELRQIIKKELGL